MLSYLRTLWLRLTTSRYTRALEDELARLRAENRALLNSILGIAGIPPLRFDAELARKHRRELHAAANDEKSGAPYDARYRSQPRAHNDGNADLRADSNARHADRSARGAHTNGLIIPPGPLRRRSWQQIGRMLEIEDARRLNNRDNSDSMS